MISAAIGADAPRWSHFSAGRLDQSPLGVSTPGSVTTADVAAPLACPALVAGVGTFTDCHFTWTHPRDEVIYIVAGTLSMECFGDELTASEGDVVFVGAGEVVTYSTTGECRLFAAQPATPDDMTTNNEKEMKL